MRCKQCREKFTGAACYQGIFYFCSKECKAQYCSGLSPIQTKNKKEGRVAHFTPEVKTQILIRDKHCIIPGCCKGITDYHHVFFGAEAQYDSGRNNADRGVGLCKMHHYEIHHGIKGIGDKLRRICITYIKNIYEKFTHGKTKRIENMQSMNDDSFDEVIHD